MNIVILSRYFPPEINSPANLLFELAKGLLGNGDKVTVVTGFPWHNIDELPEIYKGKIFLKHDMEGVEIIRVAFPVFGPKAMKLAIGHLTAPLAAIIGGLFVKKPDIVYVYSPPLFMGLAAWILRLFKRVPFVFGVQDLHPQCYIDQGVLKNKLMIALLRAIEKFCYKKADLITVHSQGNKDYIISRGIKEEKIVIFHNWIDTDAMVPLPRNNDFSRRHDLDSKFVVGYAGTIGMSQGMLSIIDAANILKDEKGIEFFIVGDGIEKDALQKKAQYLGLNNVRFLEMQPKSLYPLVVASSDIGLVTLNAKVKTPVVPSKILSMMAAGRAIIASMPLEGDAPRIIEEAKCGICIGPEDPAFLAEKILFLYRNRDLCKEYGENGRKYIVNNYALNTISKKMKLLLSGIIKTK